jgi:hypothetical protein
MEVQRAETKRMNTISKNPTNTLPHDQEGEIHPASTTPTSSSLLILVRQHQRRPTLCHRIQKHKDDDRKLQPEPHLQPESMVQVRPLPWQRDDIMWCQRWRDLRFRAVGREFGGGDVCLIKLSLFSMGVEAIDHRVNSVEEALWDPLRRNG